MLISDEIYRIFKNKLGQIGCMRAGTYFFFKYFIFTYRSPACNLFN